MAADAAEKAAAIARATALRDYHTSLMNATAAGALKTFYTAVVSQANAALTLAQAA